MQIHKNKQEYNIDHANGIRDQEVERFMEEQQTILVVDDDKSIRSVLSRFLEGRGYQVFTAETAEKAFILLQQQTFHLIITDLQMPGMDGFDLLRMVKQLNPDIPVVMLTAHSQPDVILRALRSGASDFILKPYQPDELTIIIQREISRYVEKQSFKIIQTSSGDAPGAPMYVARTLPPEQLAKVDTLIAELRFEAGARCVLVVQDSGHVISAKGMYEDVNVATLAALVAGGFSATAEIAALIGEEQPFRLNYHEGKKYSLCSAHLASEMFLLVIFGQEVKSGQVLYATRRSLPELQTIFENLPVEDMNVSESWAHSARAAISAFQSADLDQMFGENWGDEEQQDTSSHKP